MNKRSSASARVLASATLAIAFVVAAIAIGSAIGGDSSDSGGHKNGHHSSHRASQAKHVPATYEVESGDTLTSIAHHTGVSVARIERLNPEVDPQILIAGEQLKLR